jgi:hypothetical protein
MSRVLRGLIVILVLVFSLSTVAVVQVDAAPGVHRAGGVALVSSEPSAGILSWFDAVFDYLRSLFGTSCTDDPSQCNGGDAGASMDTEG